MVFDAKDLTLLSHATASDLTMVGLHNKFFPAGIGGSRAFDSAAGISATWCQVLILAVAGYITSRM